METDKNQENGNIFLIPSKRVIKIINKKNVMYIRAESNYSVFVMDDKTELIICKTLEHVENCFHQPSFFRCHKSFLVNLSKIIEISRRNLELVLVDNVRVPIARRKRKEFIKALYNTESCYLNQ
jgi:two-component system LytT family response regulator